MMRPNDSESLASGTVHEAATEWVLRLRDPDITPEEILAWQAWLRADVSHAQAFQRMEEIEEVLKSVPRPVLPGRPESDHGRRIRRSWALAGSVLVAAVAVGWALRDGAGQWAGARPVLTVASRVGENRTVHLEDGSTVMLGGDSRIEVRYSAHERHIDLTRGEAFFRVAHDRARPLKVAAGRAVVIAIGTEFDVRCATDHVVVNVVEGRVRVEPRVSFVPLPVLSALEPKLAPVAVSAGEETSVDGRSIEPAVVSEDQSAATAWTSGRLAFRMQPLEEVLDEVNRYSRKPIVLRDSALAGVRVTGTVDAANVRGWVASLGSALGIDAREEAGSIVLRKAAARDN